MRRTQLSLAVFGVLALVGGGTALAAKGKGHGALRTGVVGHRLHGPDRMLDTVSSYLGIGAADLAAQLRGGKTLADVANATNGKSAQGLVDALVAAEKKNLDAAVAAGRLTQAQADSIAKMLEQRTTGFVNGAHRGPGPHVGGGPSDDLQVAADYLGTTAASLMTQLRGGKTLADVAGATSGKSASGVIAALVAHEKTEHPQATTDELTARVTAFVNGTRPDRSQPGMPHRGFFGHGHRA